jgi:tryptophan-rich sensory protein
MKSGKLMRAALFVVVCELAGVLGSVFAIPAIPTWYAALNKPWFTPPGWVFGPVWIILYALMGIAAYWVWESKKGRLVPFAKAAFCWQLSFNLYWSLEFFGIKSIRNGLLDILALWVTLAITIVLFWKISRKAALILVPYIIWVSIATALNFYVWKLN